jgi:hypothetical protein
LASQWEETFLLQRGVASFLARHDLDPGECHGLPKSRRTVDDSRLAR